MSSLDQSLEALPMMDAGSEGARGPIADLGGAAGHLIDGRWIRSGHQGRSLEPSTGLVLGVFDEADAAIAREAARAADRAFRSTGWARDAQRRATAIERLADSLESSGAEIASMLSREGGKLLPQTTWEVFGAVQWLRYAAATARTLDAGRSAEVAPGQYYYTLPEAAGVVTIISPWNSPIILTVRALGPALAAGCTVVVKLPGQTALTNELFARAVSAVEELPPGVVNVFTETRGDGARHLVGCDEVRVISFTGSTATGRRIAAEAAAKLKRVGLELGGKTPLVVSPSADLERTIPTLIQACVMMNGQFCCTGSRILVHREIADQVREALVPALASVRPGAFEDPDAQIGPLIDRAAAERVDAIVEEAASYGTILVRGGLVEEGLLAASGAFYRPSLVEVEDLGCRLVQEEVFGPVQTFEIFDDEADAIRRANGTSYGLAASVFTRDPMQARRVGRAIQAGGLWINTWGVMSETMEAVGLKASGYGPLCGLRAIEEFRDHKTYAEIDPAAMG